MEKSTRYPSTFKLCLKQVIEHYSTAEIPAVTDKHMAQKQIFLAAFHLHKQTENDEFYGSDLDIALSHQSYEFLCNLTGLDINDKGAFSDTYSKTTSIEIAIDNTIAKLSWLFFVCYPQQARYIDKGNTEIVYSNLFEVWFNPERPLDILNEAEFYPECAGIYLSTHLTNSYGWSDEQLADIHKAKPLAFMPNKGEHWNTLIRIV